MAESLLPVGSHARCDVEIKKLRSQLAEWQRRAAFNRSVALSGETWTQEAEDNAAKAKGGGKCD